MSFLEDISASSHAGFQLVPNSSISPSANIHFFSSLGVVIVASLGIDWIGCMKSAHVFTKVEVL